MRRRKFRETYREEGEDAEREHGVAYRVVERRVDDARVRDPPEKTPAA